MPNATAADKAIAFAMAQIGKPYQWGGNGPNSYDCSGLTQQSYKAAGISIPRVARDQATVGKAVTIENVLPGDLVFPYIDYRHVAMYVGNNQVIEAPRDGVPVHVVKVYASAGGVRRIVDGGGTAINPGVAGQNVGGTSQTSPATGVLQLLQTMTSPKSWASLGIILAGIVMLGVVAINIASSEGLL